MPDGIGKDVGLAPSVLAGVLLRTYHDGFAALHAVYPVHHTVELPHLPHPVGIRIEQVLLYGTIGSDAHNYHSGFLVAVALTVDSAQHLGCRLHDGCRAVARSDEAQLLAVPVLGQVFPESIGIEKDAHRGCHAALHAQLLGTARRIVGYLRPQAVEVAQHPPERAAGADALLPCHLLAGHAVLAAQLAPRALNDDVAHLAPHPFGRMSGKVIGRSYAHGLQPAGIAPPYAPYLAHGIELQSLEPLLVAVDKAAVAIAAILLCKVRSHLGKRLVGRNAYAHGHTDIPQYLLVKVLAPLLQVSMLHAVETDEALVDAVAETGRCLLPDDAHHARRQLAIELIVRREHGYLALRKLLLELIVRHSRLDAQALGLVAARHHAAVVVRQHHHGLALQVGPEHSLAADVAVVTVYDGVVFHIFSNVRIR